MHWKDISLEYRLFSKLADGLTTSMAICFPFYLWLVGWDRPMTTAAYLGVAGSIRLVAGLSKAAYSAVDWHMITTPITLGLLALALGPEAGLYYPVAINLGLLLIFHSSLSTKANFVQRIAERIEKRPLDSTGIRYTSYVTKVWCVFFFLNALISTFFAWRKMLDEWVLYNGAIAYFAIAILFLGEWIIRPWAQNRMRRPVNAVSDQHD